MPITTKGSYVPVMQEFIAHWTDVHAEIAPDTLTLRGGFTLAQFTTARNDIQAAITAIELVAEHQEIPAEHALQGFDGVRAYSRDPSRSAALLEKVLSARQVGDTAWELRGNKRGSTIAYDNAPELAGRQSAGTVHHVAWGTNVVEHKRWHELLELVGVANSGIIDRHYFHSIYFREPSGVLFEIADDAPGFTVDVPLEELGSVVILPPKLEPHRAEIEKRLTPLPDPRAGWATSSSA